MPFLFDPAFHSELFLYQHCSALLRLPTALCFAHHQLLEQKNSISTLSKDLSAWTQVFISATRTVQGIVTYPQGYPFNLNLPFDARHTTATGFFSYGIGETTLGGSWSQLKHGVDKRDTGNGWRWNIAGKWLACSHLCFTYKNINSNEMYVAGSDLVPFSSKFFCETFSAFAQRKNSTLTFVGDSIVGGQLTVGPLNLFVEARDTSDPGVNASRRCGCRRRS